MNQLKLTTSACLCLWLTACSILPTPAPGSVLFQDDFSRQASGWQLREDDTGKAQVEDGELRVSISAPETSIITTPGLDLKDVRIETQVRKAAGPDDNSYGLVCRYSDPQNFYFFEVSSDGYYGLGKMTDGTAALFGNNLMQPHIAIQQGEAINILRFDCRGSQLSAYINGQLLAVFEDPAFESGDAGVIAGTIGSPGVEIAFDLFSVRKP